MNLPPQFVADLDHRITVLMTFTIRRDSGFFGPDHGESLLMGDLYRGSLEGAGIMLRMLLEFVGVKAKKKDPTKLTGSSCDDAVLGHGPLSMITPVRIGSLGSLEQFLARMHDDASKRTAHAGFHRLAVGLDPDDLRKATKWVLSEIWNRCYKPDPITVHPDLFRLLKGGTWEGVPFRPAA